MLKLVFIMNVSTYAKVRLHSIPGGADVLVPQNKLQMRSVGAPHEVGRLLAV
jgi:hypothetical protein